MALVGCPFCRDLFEQGEADTCPVCGVPLQRLEDLPPSYEARAARAAELYALPPEERTLPWMYLRRGRGLLFALAIAGLITFFLPWVVLEKPNVAVLSGFDFARYKGPWFWGGAVGWFILIPLVLSRRTIRAMRGVRIISATFSALTLGEVGLLLLTAPEGSRYISVDYSWGIGLYASALVSVLAIAVSARFGGRTDDIELPAQGSDDPLARPLPESTTTDTLH